MRDGHFASPSASCCLPFLSLQHRFAFILLFISYFLTRLTQAYSLAQSLPPSLSPPYLFMQPEPTTVSQHTPPVDSYPVIISPTQHGHDLDDAQVSDFLEREEIGDSADVPSMSTQDESDASLNEVDGRHSPPSADRLSQHENVSTSSGQAAKAGSFLVASIGQPQYLETLPNGRCPATPAPQLFLTTVISRGSHPYPIASNTAILVRHNLGVPSISCAGDYSACMENRLLAILPRAPCR